MTDTIYVSVSVPRNAVAAADIPAGLAFGLGTNGSKMAARLIAPHAVRHKGKTVVCKVSVVSNPKAKRKGQTQVHLTPVNRRSPTHVIRQDEQGGPVFQKLEDA